MTAAVMAELLSVRGAALALKVNASTISRYLKDHPDLNLGSRTRPKIDIDVLRRHRAENTNPSQQRGRHSPMAVAAPEAPPAATEPPGPNYQVAKAVRETVLAQRARVDLDEKRKLLVSRVEVENAVYDAGTVLQRDLLELGPQLAERLASMTDAREIGALLEAEHRRVLAGLAASLRATAAEEEAKAHTTAEVVTLEPRPRP
jgi:hypothetical protein